VNVIVETAKQRYFPRPVVLNTLASGWFWRFSQKKQQFLVALPTP